MEVCIAYDIVVAALTEYNPAPLSTDTIIREIIEHAVKPVASQHYLVAGLAETLQGARDDYPRPRMHIQSLAGRNG